MSPSTSAPCVGMIMMNLNLNGEAGKAGASALEPAVEGHRREGEHASAAMVAVLDPAKKQEDVASCLAQHRLPQSGAAGEDGNLVLARRKHREELGCVWETIVLEAGKKQDNVFLGQTVDVDKEKSAEMYNL